MMQQGFDFLRSNDSGARIAYWHGYSWTMPKSVLAWSHGIVCTPRWAARAAKAGMPIMLDNGAFPAWRDGRTMSGEMMFIPMRSAIEKLGSIIRWAIAPDIIAQGEKSWELSRHWAPRLEALGVRVMVPIQEGMDIDIIAPLCESRGWGLFIGGATFAWKREAAKQCRRAAPQAHIHVARIWKEGDVQAMAGVAESFDNTTYTRGQRFNARQRELVQFDDMAQAFLEPPCGEVGRSERNSDDSSYGVQSLPDVSKQCPSEKC